ncbi:MAG: FG-GAP repeat domain-containing protein [Planctomycetota bacterium]|jgi:hypothetical protein
MKLSLNRSKRLVATAVILLGAIATVIVSCRGNYAGSSEEGDFLVSGKTHSHFSAVQVDPRSEDSAGPQFVAAEDLNGDGLLDLVSAWNQSQPLQIHLQRRSGAGEISFETITLAGTEPTVTVAGLALADFDLDGQPDIMVLIKQAGVLSTGGCLPNQDGIDPDVGVCSNSDECSIAIQNCIDESQCRPPPSVNGAIFIYLGPEDPAQVNQALAWEEAAIGEAFLSGSGTGDGPPEVDGYTGMVVGDVDQDGDLDVVVAWNTACGANEIVLFTNQGAGGVRIGTWNVETMPNLFGIAAEVKDVALADVDRDGDLDVVATRPNSETLNLHWFRNPALDVPDDFHISDGEWQEGTIGQIAASADIVRLGDVDRDGIMDVVVRSTTGRVLQWLKGPAGPTTSPVRALPWEVYTVAEFTERTPEALALGDLNFDGQLDVIASAEGGLLWFDADDSPYDQWREILIVDEQSEDDTDPDIPATDPGVTPDEISGETNMNTILVVDLDGDGANDLVVPFDRNGLSGLTNDALVWFRNTKRPPR